MKDYLAFDLLSGLIEVLETYSPFGSKSLRGQMHLFGNTVAILNSIVSNNHYGMLREGGKLLCVAH